MPELLPTVDQQGAVKIIEKLMNVFDVKELNVSFDTSCGGSGFCYTPSTNTIHLFPDERIPEFVIAHEFGHALEKAYAGSAPECTTYEECEGFATMFQGIYMVTNGSIANFKCSICGQSSLTIKPDGRLLCNICRSEYFINFYDVEKYNGISSKNLYYGCPCNRSLATTATTTAAATSCPPSFSDIVHLLLGSIFPLGAAALYPGDSKASLKGAGWILAFATIKEFFFDPVAEGQQIQDSLKDFTEYFAGAGASLILLKAKR
jgi:hypothetical protein